jgi:hypothetical protein
MVERRCEVGRWMSGGGLIEDLVCVKVGFVDC